MCFLGNKGQKNKNKTATNDLICFETSDLTIPPSMGSDPSLSPTAGV